METNLKIVVLAGIVTAGLAAPKLPEDTRAESSADSNSVEAPRAVEHLAPPQGGSELKAKQPLGGRCAVDRQCQSSECKGLKCVRKTTRKAPLGASCWFDGDCESLECKRLKCVKRG